MPEDASHVRARGGWTEERQDGFVTFRLHARGACQAGAMLTLMPLKPHEQERPPSTRDAEP